MTEWAACSLCLVAAGSLYISWLLLVVLVFVYNCWMVPYRAFFLYGRQGQCIEEHPRDGSLSTLLIVTFRITLVVHKS